MGDRPPRYPFRLYAFLVLGAVGLALVAVGITGDTGWALIAPGFVAVIVALVSAWRIMARYTTTASRL